MTESEAWANLADGVSRALAQFAVELRAARADSPAPADLPRAGELGSPRGKRQREVLELPAVVSPGGVTATEVAAEVGVTGPNAYKLLSSLVASGWLEEVPEVEPRHWRRPG